MSDGQWYNWLGRTHSTGFQIQITFLTFMQPILVEAFLKMLQTTIDVVRFDATHKVENSKLLKAECSV